MIVSASCGWHQKMHIAVHIAVLLYKVREVVEGMPHASNRSTL